MDFGLRVRRGLPRLLGLLRQRILVTLALLGGLQGRDLGDLGDLVQRRHASSRLLFVLVLLLLLLLFLLLLWFTGLGLRQGSQLLVDGLEL